MTQRESASKTQTAQYRAPRPRLHLPKNNSHELIRCNGDVNVTVINSKTKINGCNGSQEDGKCRFWPYFLFFKCRLGCLSGGLDDPAIRNANRGNLREPIRANRFAEKTLFFITCERFARIASNLRFAIFSPPKRDSFGNPEMIRKNQAIRANLRIDSRESGHLRVAVLLSLVPVFWKIREKRMKMKRKMMGS